MRPGTTDDLARAARSGEGKPGTRSFTTATDVLGFLLSLGLAQACLPLLA